MRIVLLLLSVDLVRGNEETDDVRKKVKDPVIFKLRSQLMEDNYDYESEPVASVNKIPRAEPTEEIEEEQENIIEKRDDSELSDFPSDRNVLNGYISGIHVATDDEEADEEGTDTDPDEATAVDRADGVTEEPTEATTVDEWIEVIKAISPASPYLFGADTTTELPYKVLTAHGPNFRRSGGGDVHRYLKAEINDSVLVAPFSPGPIPLFMLPKSRRQYREDSDGDNITGEDDAWEPPS